MTRMALLYVVSVVSLGIASVRANTDGLRDCLCVREEGAPPCPAGSQSDRCIDYYVESMDSQEFWVWGVVWLLLLCASFLVCFRACGLCGGSRPQEGFCSSSGPFRGYSGYAAPCCRFAVFMWIPFLIGAVVMALVFSNEALKDDLKGIGDRILVYSNDNLETVRNVNAQFQDLREDISDSDRRTMQDAVTTVTDVASDVENGIGDVYKVDHDDMLSRYNVTILVFALALIPALMVCCLLPTRGASCLSSCTIFTILLLGTVILLVGTFSHITFAGMDTLCADYNVVTEQPFKALRVSLRCDPQDGDDKALGLARSQLKRTKVEFVSRVCTDVVKYGQTGGLCDIFRCPDNNGCSGNGEPENWALLGNIVTDSAVSGTYSNRPEFRNCPAPCSIEQCAADCSGAVREQSQNAFGNWTRYSKVLRNIDMESPVLNCVPLSQLREDLVPLVCDYRDSLQGFTVLLVIIISVFLVWAFLLMCAPKRFDENLKESVIKSASSREPAHEPDV